MKGHLRDKISARVQEFLADTKRYLGAFLFFGLAALAFWGLTRLLYTFYGFELLEWFKTLPIIAPAAQSVLAEISRQTFLGIFYLFAFSSLFFLPAPLEVVFVALLQDANPTTVLFATLIGVFVGQHINYFLGRLFGPLFTPYIKKRTQQKTKKQLKRYGVYAITGFNLIPFFPFPLFNFIVGLAKYPYLRWLIPTTVALLVRFGIIWLIFA